MAMTPRAAALVVLEKCRRSGAWSDAALGGVIETAELDARDAALCTKLCSGVLQNTNLCDFYIDCYSSVKSNKLEPKVRDILRLSIYQLLFLDRIPAHAVVSEGVSLVKKHCKRASGLSNAVLRRVSENKDNLPAIPNAGTSGHLSIKYSHPQWLCDMLIAEHGYDFTESLLEANNAEVCSMAQVNTVKISTAELLEKLTQDGVEAKLGAVKDSIELLNHGDLTRLQSFRDGLFYIQDNAAKMSILRAEPKSGMSVLDACAAPGGKSFATAVAMANVGEIISCDIGSKKLTRIEASAKRLGIDIISTQTMDARAPKEEFAEKFDLVIADVPCSGIGVIRKKPDIRIKKSEDIARLPEIQLDILRGVSKCVKSGGTLLYSTCTVLKRENNDVVTAFLSENDGFELDGEMETLFPHINNTDGFFICKLRKK